MRKLLKFSIVIKLDLSISGLIGLLYLKIDLATFLEVKKMNKVTLLFERVMPKYEADSREKKHTFGIHSQE